MHRVKVHKEIEFIIAIFQYLRFWDVSDENICNKRVKVFLLILFASLPVSFALGALTNQNNEESIYLAVGAIANTVQFARLWYIIWRGDTIFTIIHDASTYTVDNEDFIQIDKRLQKFMKYVKYFILMIFITVCFISAFAAVSEEKTLPFNIAFPLDWKNSEVGYWMAFIYLLIQSVFTSVIFLLDVIIWYLMLSFTIHYELLGNQMRRMGTIRSTDPQTRKRKISEPEKQHIFLQDFIAAAKTYQNIRETIKQFESCFSNLFFIQIVTSSMGLCGSVYTLAFISIENMFEYFLYISSVFYCIFDIFTTMYLGNEIKLSSDRLSYCLFESNWVEQSLLCKKYIIIFVEMIKQPHELVIVIYPLNLETFRRILNLAYNMFNILRNLN